MIFWLAYLRPPASSSLLMDVILKAAKLQYTRSHEVLYWADQYVSTRHSSSSSIHEYVYSYTWGHIWPRWTALIWAWWSDAMQLRWPPILVAGVSHSLASQVQDVHPLIATRCRHGIWLHVSCLQSLHCIHTLRGTLFDQSSCNWI